MKNITFNVSTNSVEILYNNIKQGEINIDGDKITLGLVEYINTGNGVLTLRSAIPESDLSEYNITKMLCDEVNKIYKFNLTPRMFGKHSFKELKIKEEYSFLTKDELIDRLFEAEEIINNF